MESHTLLDTQAIQVLSPYPRCQDYRLDSLREETVMEKLLGVIIWGVALLLLARYTISDVPWREKGWMMLILAAMLVFTLFALTEAKP